MFEYLYFTLALYFFLWWLLFFLWNRNIRTEMIFMSLVGLVFGPLVQFMHLKDWWSPNLILAGPVNPEDLLFGFAVGGVSAVIYQAIRSIRERRVQSLMPPVWHKLSMLIVGLFLLFGLFYFFDIHSFWTSIIALSATVGLILLRRRDLAFLMASSAVLITLIAIPFYIFALWINPFWFEQEWFMHNLSGFQLLRIPLEELAWYFFIGLAFSALWEFQNGLKLIKSRKVAQ